MEPEGSLPCSQKPTNSEALCNISKQAGFCGEELLAPRLTPKLEYHPLSAVQLLILFYHTALATLRTIVFYYRRFRPSSVLLVLVK